MPIRVEKFKTIAGDKTYYIIFSDIYGKGEEVIDVVGSKFELLRVITDIVRDMNE